MALHLILVYLPSLSCSVVGVFIYTSSLVDLQGVRSIDIDTTPARSESYILRLNVALLYTNCCGVGESYD